MRARSTRPRRVAEYIPEFGTEGKDVITVEQVMLHTSGFPHAPFQPLEWDDRDARLARFAKWRCNWEPGTAFEYHATSAHWVLAELIERATGRDFREYIRTQVIEPLGLTRLRLGVPEAEQGDINELVNVGELPSREELMAAIGIPELPYSEVTADALLALNHPAVRAVGLPGGGGVSTASDLALFYQGVLHNTAGIWAPEVLENVTTVVRNSFPDYLGTPANRTLGLVLAGCRRALEPPGHGQDRVARDLRAQRRRWADRVGGPGDRPLVRLPHQRDGAEPDPGGAADDRDRESGRQLRRAPCVIRDAGVPLSGHSERASTGGNRERRYPQGRHLDARRGLRRRERRARGRRGAPRQRPHAVVP